MKKLSAIILPLAFLLRCCFPAQSNAQPRSAGGLFSFNGIGLAYQHCAGEKVFFELDAVLDFSGIIFGQTAKPGIRAGLSYNFIFFEKDCSSGKLSVYSGPGITVGYVRNKNNFGPMIGLGAHIGLEYRFTSRPLSMSVGIAPLLALHMNSSDKNSSLDFFREGFYSSLFPVLGLRYYF